MKTPQRWQIWVIGASLLGAVIWFFQPHPPADRVGWLFVDNTAYQLEIADTDAERSVGLGYRDTLCATCGMIFVFPQKTQPIFWMKGMRFNLDFLWVADGRIVQKNEDVSFQSQELLRVSTPVDAVVELPSGATRDLRVGDSLDLHY